MIRFLLIHLQVLFSFSLAGARLSDRVDEREKLASSEVANEKKWREDRRGSLLAPPTTPASSWKTVSRFRVSNNWRSKSWNKLSQLTNRRVYQAGAGILESGIEKNYYMLHYSSLHKSNAIFAQLSRSAFLTILEYGTGYIQSHTDFLYSLVCTVRYRNGLDARCILSASAIVLLGFIQLCGRFISHLSRGHNEVQNENWRLLSQCVEQWH